MATGKQVYDELVRICKDIEEERCEAAVYDEPDHIFMFGRKQAAQEIRILLSHKFPEYPWPATLKTS